MAPPRPSAARSFLADLLLLAGVSSTLAGAWGLAGWPGAALAGGLLALAAGIVMELRR